jgi:hypothetical protein
MIKSPPLQPRLVLALLLMPLGGCASNDLLVPGDETWVAGSQMTVNPDSTWSRVRASASQTRWEEVWTRNGPQLDRLSLLGGLPDGKAMISLAKDADQQVPVFRAGMTAEDLASMLEVSYRVNGVAVFDFVSVEPVDFLDGAALGMRYRYASGVGYTKQGRCVMRIVDGKLYAMKLEGVAGPRFDAVAPEFERLVASARLR